MALHPLLVLTASLFTLTLGNELNNRPIIGILAQDYYGSLKYGRSYIAASYVKYLEAAGARVAPVLVNQSLEYYAEVVNSTNGFLFPGGNQYFNETGSGYGTAGQAIYKLAIQANNRGDYYPVWGTCLGFELLTYLTSNLTMWLTKCNAHDVALPLNFVHGVVPSKLLSSMPTEIKYDLSTLPITANYHTNCITPKNFIKSGLNKFYNVLSTNVDTKNVTFVSTIEAYRLPIYGTAWHPEKNQFEFGLKKGLLNIPHSYEAIRMGQHFANFFVNEARRSNHRFPNAKREDKALIYNYQPVYTAPSGSSFEQCYFFQ